METPAATTPAAVPPSTEPTPAASTSSEYAVKKSASSRSKCFQCKEGITKDVLIVTKGKHNFHLDCFEYDVPLEGYDKLDEGDRKTVDTQREKNKGKAPEGKKRSPKSPKQPKKEVKEKVYAVDSVKSTRCKCFTCGESFKSMETAIGQKSAGGFKSRFHIPCFPIVIEDTATIVDFDKLSADDQEKLRKRLQDNKVSPPQPPVTRAREVGKKRVQPKRDSKAAAASKRERKEEPEEEEKEEKEAPEKEEKAAEKKEEKKVEEKAD